MKKSLTLLAAFIFGLTLFGFGCKKDTAMNKASINSFDQPATTSTQPIKKPTTPTQPTPAAPAPSSDILYLKQVMKNLLQVRSFRASMSVPSTDGTLTGEIEFVRQGGLHGTLNLPGQITSEVYLLGQDIFFRTGTSTWINLSAKPEGKKAAELFQSAFSLNADETSIPISNSARVLGISDDPQGCKLYTITQSKSDGSGPQQSQICVKNDLPVYLKAPGDQGIVQVSYRDFNTDIKLNPPSVK
ncbi:hypothetical protein EXS71_01335 [Candidatus Uhrbacteria bacterium]|nr:hypothetical protein [Candidatus Uhrbacteria bacterium]